MIKIYQENTCSHENTNLAADDMGSPMGVAADMAIEVQEPTVEHAVA
jgi:hypothetical protein